MHSRPDLPIDSDVRPPPVDLSDAPSQVTRLLGEAAAGSAGAGDALLPLVYNELKLLARQKMAQERAGHTLQATALVHEAYLRLVGSAGDGPGGAGGPGGWAGR